MAKGQIIEVKEDHVSVRQTSEPSGSSFVQPPSDIPFTYGTVNEREVLMPHSAKGGLEERSQKRLRRVVLLLVGMVILVKAMILLPSKHSSAAAAPQKLPHTPAPASVWHAAATPNHARPGFGGAALHLPHQLDSSDVTFN